MLLKTKCFAEQDFTEIDYSTNFEGHTEAAGSVTELVYLHFESSSDLRL
jgi:hypothetical protein